MSAWLITSIKPNADWRMISSHSRWLVLLRELGYAVNWDKLTSLCRMLRTNVADISSSQHFVTPV